MGPELGDFGFELNVDTDERTRLEENHGKLVSDQLRDEAAEEARLLKPDTIEKIYRELVADKSDVAVRITRIDNLLQTLAKEAGILSTELSLNYIAELRSNLMPIYATIQNLRALYDVKRSESTRLVALLGNAKCENTDLKLEIKKITGVIEESKDSSQVVNTIRRLGLDEEQSV